MRKIKRGLKTAWDFMKVWGFWLSVPVIILIAYNIYPNPEDDPKYKPKNTPTRSSSGASSPDFANETRPDLFSP